MTLNQTNITNITTVPCSAACNQLCNYSHVQLASD